MRAGIVASARMASGGSLSDAILALGPAGYWPLTETSGTTATDSSGNGRHGTYSGTVTLAARDGHPTFAGGHVNIPDHDAWTPGTTGAITVFVIVYLNAVTAARQIFISKGAGSQFEWQMEAESSAASGRPVATWYGGSDVWQNEGLSSAHPTGQWAAWAFSIGDPSGMGERFPVYLDSGTPLSTTQPYPPAGPVPGNRQSPMRLAGRGDGVGPWYGAIAHAAIFPSKLTTPQVGALMSAASSEGY